MEPTAVPQSEDLAWHVKIKCYISKSCGTSRLYSWFLERLGCWSTAFSVWNFKVTVRNKKCTEFLVSLNSLKTHQDRSEMRRIHTVHLFYLMVFCEFMRMYVWAEVASFNNWFIRCQKATGKRERKKRKTQWETKVERMLERRKTKKHKKVGKRKTMSEGGHGKRQNKKDVEMKTVGLLSMWPNKEVC